MIDGIADQFIKNKIELEIEQRRQGCGFNKFLHKACDLNDIIQIACESKFAFRCHSIDELALGGKDRAEVIMDCQHLGEAADLEDLHNRF